MKSNILILFLLALVHLGYSQYYIQGQNRFSLKWKQINTEYFQVIFIEDNEKEAQRVANILKGIYEKVNASMASTLKKTSIILQNQTVTSNGFATLAPRRSEFYQMPEQNNANLDWLSLLCIHEYRHIVQIDKFDKGLSKLAAWIMGEQGQGAVLGATTPLWFLEGDAVGIETSLSRGGRGRIPSFDMQLKAQFLEFGKLHYDKAIFGSYKDYIPDYYTIGYHLTTYAKNEFGRNIWDSVLTDVSKFPLRPFPFSNALKKESGLSTQKLYESTYKQLDSIWSLESFQSKHYEHLSVSKLDYHNALYPVEIDSNKIVYLETSYDFVSHLALYDITANKSSRIEKLANYNGTRFSYRNNQIAFTCSRQHPRWGYESYSELYIYDFKTKETRKLPFSQKAFSPTLSNDATKLAFIEVDHQNTHYLVVVNTQSGKELIRKEAPYNHQYIEPYWDNNQIVLIDFINSTNQLLILDVGTTKMTPVSEKLPYNIQTPFLRDNNIYFSAARTGIQNIYRLQNGVISPVTNCTFGGFNPSLTNTDQLLFNDYTAKGYRITKDTIRTYGPLKTHFKFYEKMVSQENLMYTLDSLPSLEYDVDKYSSFSGLINPHSWQPFYLNPTTQEVGIGAGILSQNLLSTSVGSLNYRYIPSEERHISNLKLSYLGFFPQLDFKYQYEWFPFISEDISYNIEYSSVTAAVNVPLSFYSPSWYKSIKPEVSFSRNDFTISDGEQKLSGANQELEVSNQFYVSSYKAKKDISSPFSTNLFTSYAFYFADSEQSTSFTNIFELGARTFLHHTLSFTYKYQNNETANVALTNYNILPIGYQLRTLTEINSFVFKYSLPLLYPDVKISALAYIQRIRCSLGYEYAVGDRQKFDSRYFDLIFDTNLLRYAYLMEIGIKIIHLPREEQVLPNLIFGVSF